MDLEQAIWSRRAVREYADVAVSQSVLGRLIEAAIQAPSALNEQPWLFTVIRDRDLLARISREAKAHVLRAPPQTLAPQLRERLERPGFDIFYRAPALVLISSVTHDRWATENCSLAAENLMLASRALGLGSCWIGLAQLWLGTPEGKALLELPPACLPVAPIIVGEPKSLPPAVPRLEPRIDWIGA
jgi:nitroreductase